MIVPRAKTPLEVVIVGAGIGGMAAALALGQRGHHVIVLESAPKLMEVGAGIQGSPNMLTLFDRWGVSPLIHAKDVALEYIHVRRWQDGSLLGTMPVNKSYGQQVVVHRADLHNALIEKAIALENVQVRVNSTVTRVQFDPPAVTLADGTVVQADVVLAADGIKSSIRDQLLGKDATKAIPTGDAAYRIMLPRSAMENDPELKQLIDEPQATRWIGPYRHIIAYPVRNHQLYNIVLLHPDRTDVEESWTTRGSKQMMVDDYRGWDRRVTKLIDLVKDNEVLEWKLCQHPPLKTWIKGRVALLGDACHPMLPYVGQGAAQAVEDAAALGVLLSTISSRREIPLALAVYERSRKHRAETVQQSGTVNRATLHLPDGPEQQARDDQFRASMNGASNPDKWADLETQKFLWGWDAEKVALETWEEFRGNRLTATRHHL
ncbi:putative salicylate hydroxylase [Aspergillus lentulus]|uniref:Salicylate hydroxylase n=1 Tax=Aspergillus lentulus TaxID=293939 RepID=A0ABQ1AF20_ASPLE|nr:putative salicylate hydroxylase [Aspergillus lentulus]GFF39126.1 putative salicylate hydroxylase [Aspergillus lentulus]GFF62455.1 putative salicylate hydroxylase [Aspergillus lentulus]GFF80564.1 putative salicylate hydroxylase [Aspergillus lentulus]GFG08818.1 putative salicylate hydroxylase [Aspergillus lentulus]